MKKTVSMLAALTLLFLCAGAASAQHARIDTGSGALNMRRKAEAKATVLERIPNGETVEVEAEEEGWARIVYKGKTGYVMAKYLKPADAPERGQPAEKGESSVQTQKDDVQSAPILQEAGYATIITKSGKLNMRRKADGESAVIAQVPNGERVAVEKAWEDWSAIVFEGKTGYVRTEFLRLDAMMIGRRVYPDDAYLLLREQPRADAQCVASVHAAQAITIAEMGEQWIGVTFENPYCGAVDGYAAAEDISLWRETPSELAAAPFSAHMTLNAYQLAPGEILDVRLQKDAEAQCLYTLTRDGERIFSDLPASSDAFSYHPPSAGAYCLTAFLQTADGCSIACEKRFAVSEGDAPSSAFELYSQKDGWWLDKKYGKSNLDQSGCAIFALSHALQLLGLGGEEASPQALAERFPMYLTESGTVTENLIAAAGRYFGFSTGKDKYKKHEDIVSRFEEGAVFSFSVADGHIALAAGLSEDGTMVRVLDSAPSATFERIQNASLYYPDGQGGYLAASTLWDVPGVRYYIVTNDFGGLEYYLDLDYVASRGVRMIRRAK